MNIGRSSSVGLFVLTLASAGCAGTNAGTTPGAVASSGRGSQPSHPAPQAGADVDWTVSLATDGRAGAVRASIRGHRSVPSRWSVGATMSKLEVRDAKGSRALMPVDGIATLPADVTAPFELRYDVAPGAASACPFDVTPDRAVFCGDAVLARPVDGADERVAMRLSLTPDPDLHAAAASSFGPGNEAVARASFDDAAHAAFVFGRIGHATFDAVEGRDHASWVDSFSFDPRWVAAEAAGVRTLVDRGLGMARPADDPSVGLVFFPIPGQAREPSVRRGLRGIVVEAGVATPWTPRARIDVARLFVQRTLGPSVTIGDEGSTAASRVWFEEGVAHAVALEVLRGAGIITDAEAIAEVNSWLAAETLEKQEAELRRSAVRGALVGIALARGETRSTTNALRSLLADIREKGRPTRTIEELFAAAKISPQAQRSLLDAMASTADIPLETGAMGPCARLSKGTIHPFELGFRVAGGRAEVDSVQPGSAAAKAGVSEGDAIVGLDYVDGSASTPVRLRVDRKGEVVEMMFLPRGPGRPGRSFVAVKSAACRL